MDLEYVVKKQKELERTQKYIADYQYSVGYKAAAREIAEKLVAYEDAGYDEVNIVELVTFIADNIQDNQEKQDEVMEKIKKEVTVINLEDIKKWRNLK